MKRSLAAQQDAFVTDTVTSWDCSVNAPGELTVGAKFNLECHGDSQTLSQERIAVVTREIDPQTQMPSPYHLKLLKIEEFESGHLKATVTSYRPGEYSQDGYFILTDGGHQISLRGIHFKVNSVIDPQKGQEPYPAFPPWVMSFPIWFYIAIALGVITPLWTAIYFFRKNRQKRKLIASLKSQKTLRSPFDEFHREIRVLEKKFGIDIVDPAAFLRNLEDIFRMYLVRELIIPAKEWSNSAIISEIIKQYPELHKHAGVSLRRLLKEFEQSARAHPKSEDAKQIFATSLKVAESIFKFRPKEVRGRV